MASIINVKTLVFLLWIATFLIGLFSCDKEHGPRIVNIVLYDKPLDVMRSYVQGNWKLKKISGGICPGCYPQPTNDPYMYIKGDRIVMGNNLGITIDTIIVWKRVKVS
jgi:hypothetical protein